MAFCGQCGTKSSGGAFCAECGSSIAGGSAAPTRVAAPTSYIELPEQLYEDDQDADLIEGLGFYDAGDWAEALEPLGKSASKGNVTAIFKLANSLDNLGNEDDAIPLWEVAANWGHQGACNNFAIRLKDVGDVEGARELYRRSAAAGNYQAMFNLALTYGDSEDDTEYRKWLLKASDAGMLRAQAILGDHLIQRGEEGDGLELIEDALSKGSLTAHVLAATVAIGELDFARAHLLAEAALVLPLNDDDKHLLKNAYYVRGISGDQLGNRAQAIEDVKTAADMGFDVSSAPLYLRVPESGRKPSSPQKSYNTISRTSMTDSTTFESKCDILAEVFTDCRNDPDWIDFFDYNDIGLPLAYLLSTDIVKSTPKAQIFVEETFASLLESVGGAEDTGFESLEEILNWDSEE
jgi:TPR repeat protein